MLQLASRWITTVLFLVLVHFALFTPMIWILNFQLWVAIFPTVYIGYVVITGRWKDLTTKERQHGIEIPFELK